MEEENITNRLQRQVDLLLGCCRQVETKLQAKGSSLADLGITLPVFDIPGDEWERDRYFDAKGRRIIILSIVCYSPHFRICLMCAAMQVRAPGLHA